MFIVFDGLDGCGKSLISSRVAGLLAQKGQRVLATRDPGGTGLAEKIRNVILHEKDVRLDRHAEFLLYNAARAQLLTEVIAPALSDGMTVVCDRFDSSTYAYQVHANEFPERLFDALRTELARLAMPDYYVVLDVPLEVAARRLSGVRDRIESRDLAYHRRVREGFGLFVQKNAERAVLLNAEPDAETVLAGAVYALRKRFGEDVV